MSARGGRAGLMLVPVLALVNSAAIWGQAGWALEHIVPTAWPDWRARLALALAFAAAIELIGVFLATAADEAETSGQPAGGVRLGSYAVGLVSGALNFSHWWPGLAAALAFGFLSAVSPFLWGVWARVRRGSSVAPSRRFWHPIGSIALIRLMAWRGIASEAEGLEQLERQRTPSPAPAVSPAPLLHVQEQENAPRVSNAPALHLWEKEKEQRKEQEQKRALGAKVPDSADELIEQWGSAPSPAPSSPAPAREGTPRTRATVEQLHAAVADLLDGQPLENAARSNGVGVSTLRRYEKARRLLLQRGPDFSIDVVAEKLQPAVVDFMRSWLREVR